MKGSDRLKISMS